MATFAWQDRDTIVKTEQVEQITTHSLSAHLAREAEYLALAAQYTTLAAAERASYDELIAQAGRPA